jgi:acyl-CoA synthetase (AMP-forming)/AMP-acid ligase II
VQKERITHSLLVPTLLYRLLEMRSTQVYDLSSLRTLFYGAAPMAPATVQSDQLIDHVKARLGSYKAPKTIKFVDELPLSPVGKVMRRLVKKRYWVGQERCI